MTSLEGPLTEPDEEEGPFWSDEQTEKVLTLCDCFLERIGDEVVMGDAEYLKDLCEALSYLVECLR